MTLDRDVEERHLKEAERLIAEAETRMKKHELLLHDLRQDSHDTKEGERLLLGMRDTLRIMQEHRALIVDTIADIDAGRI